MDGLEQETVYLIDAVTTNKTDFFREAEHFDFLQAVALPALAQRRRSVTIRAWSAACSTGAEPYTMAMVLEEFAERERRYRLRDPGHRSLHRGARSGQARHLSRRDGRAGARRAAAANM